ncbi:hypothetical protein BDV18DRAFT_163605 [Aspergillus unguis]
MSQADIALSGVVYWSKPFDFQNGENVTITRTEKYKWSRTLTKSHFWEDANKAVIDAKARSKFTSEEGASWEVVTAKITSEIEMSLDVANTMESVSKSETHESFEESGEKETKYTVGPKGRLIAYQMVFIGPGVSVASEQIITRSEPDPALEKRLSVKIDCELKAKRFLKDIKVVYGRWENQKPVDCIPVIDNKSPDINKGFSESDFVWLVPVWGSKASDSETCTYLGCRLTGSREPDASDLAKGAGGEYRYLDIGRNPAIRDKIVDVRMLRSEGKQSSQDAKNQGFPGISNDFNVNRNHDWLYLIWKTINVDDTVVS